MVAGAVADRQAVAVGVLGVAVAGCMAMGLLGCGAPAETAAGAYLLTGEVNGMGGACYADVGRDADARAVLAQAEKLYDDAHIPEHDYAEMRIIESDLAAKAGDKAKAIALVERVLATTSDDDPNPAMAQLRTYARESLAHWKR